MRIRKLTLYGFFAVAFLSFAALAQADQHKMPTKEMLSYTCVSCHGPNGHSMGPAAPSIGGQPKNYLIAAMLGYKFVDAPEELDKLMEQERFEDLEFHPRYSTIMNRLMTGYSVDEIVTIADYFASFEWKPVKGQDTDSEMAASGTKLHKKFCEKCHEDLGMSSVDDISIVAGQWMPYLHYTMKDYLSGNSKMPKKMKSKLDDLVEDHGHDGVHDLLNLYSQDK